MNVCIYRYLYISSQYNKLVEKYPIVQSVFTPKVSEFHLATFLL